MSTETQTGSEATATGSAPPPAADQAAAGRAALDGGAQGTPAGGSSESAAGGGSENSADAWAGLEEGTRALVTSKGYRTPNDLAKAYMAAESKLGSALTVPGDDASAEDWAAFHAKVGRPETADKYAFKLPEGVPENLPYDSKIAESLKSWAHEAGLTQRQAEIVHDQYVRYAAGQMAAMGDMQERRADAAHQELVKEWGDPKGPQFQRNTELASRAIRNAGGEALVNELKSFGILNARGEPLSPKLAMMLAQVGNGLYAEDTLFGRPEANGKNPFSQSTQDWTEMGRVISEARKDPAKREYAVALMRNANPPVNPAEHGFR